jgi:hypothetical protein
VIAPITPSTGETTNDLAAVLHDVEVIPPQFLDMVIALGHAPAFGASLRIPNLLGVLDPHLYTPLGTAEDAFSNPPTQAKAQELPKQLLR